MLHIVGEASPGVINPRIPYGPFVHETPACNFAGGVSLHDFLPRGHEIIPRPIIRGMGGTGFIKSAFVVKNHADGGRIPGNDVSLVIYREAVNHLWIIGP